MDLNRNSMSLKRNIIANYASQIYVTAANIIMVPLYMHYMGAEAYGLVGFFAMVQIWFNLLDMGLTPTIARESARFHGGAVSLLEYRQLARALESVFLVVALTGGAILLALSKQMAEKWINTIELPISEVAQALQTMAIIVVLRWMCGFYRGVISGAERLIWLSVFGSFIATARFVFVMPVLMFVGASPIVFFGYQLCVALLELAGLALMAYRLLPEIPKGERIIWEWISLKPILKFSLSIAVTSSIWVLVTQTDKLILSKILALSDYAYYTVAVLVASSIMVVSGPISSALMPRMARLQSEGKPEELLAVYRKATQFVTVISLPVTLMLALFPLQVLWAWTGDAVMAEKAGSVLRLYAVGYGFLAVGAFPYYLQYAKGDLRLHLIGNTLFVVFLIPSLIWATMHYGMTGAGWVWLINNAIYFFCWTPLVHHRFAKRIHCGWLFRDIGLIAVPCLLLGLLVVKFIPFSNQRWVLLGEMVLMGFVLMIFAYAMSSRLNFFNRIRC